MLRVVWSLVSCFCVDSTGTPRHNVTGSVVGSGQRRSLRFSAVHRSSAVSLQSFPPELDQVAFYTIQALLDLDVSIVLFYWICIEVNLKVDSVVVYCRERYRSDRRETNLIPCTSDQPHWQYVQASNPLLLPAIGSIIHNPFYLIIRCMYV